jgi:cytochrome c-type biogenesis protein CcmH
MKRLAVILCLLAAPVLAVEPSEMLRDPVLETRAQALDHELRCVKCQSEAIASSSAAWAADARVLVRELIAEGKSDAEVMDFFVDRYGEYVRMRPAARGAGLVLWIAGPLMLLAGIGVAALAMRGRRGAPEVAALGPEEQARLDQILRDRGS